MRLRRFLKYWLPVLAWMTFIFVGSTDLLSAEHTSRFIGPFLRWFAPDISGATVASIQLIVRKFGHLTEYAILAALLCRALRFSSQGWFGAFGISAIYASLDEFHQSFVSSRTGTPWDVLIDCIGAIIGVVIYSSMTRNPKSKSLLRQSG
jgi:VanZ family protein